jgi:hypothetical protein
LLSFAGEHKYQWTGTDKEPHAFPAPGQYQLFLTVSVTDVENSKVKWWQGTLISNPVEFEIADKPAGDAKASEPAVKDGLAITLKLNKPVFAKGERPAFDVILENRSTKAFQLWINFDVLDYPYLFVNLDDKSSWQVQKRKLKDGNGARSVTLDPGKSQVLNVVFMYGAYVDAAGQGLRADLPVGKYRLSGTLTFKEGTQNNLVPYWTGEITTNPVEIEIADKPASGAKASEPAVKDGLSITVAPAKAAFAEGEMLAFEVTYRNESKKAFRLPDKPALVNYWTFHFETVAENRRYTGRSTLPMGEIVPGQPTAPLEAGASLLAEAALHKSFRFVSGAWPNETNPKDSLGSLPPGRYRVKIEMWFSDPVDTTGEPPVWPDRAITTNPVEFAVAAVKPPDKMSVEQLVADLDSADGAKRVAATKEIFRRGKAILKDLEKAGAKPAQTIQPPRRDMVYSLLEGSFAGRYTTGSFGIHLNSGVTRKDVNEMGKKYGFSLGDEGRFHEDGHPNCYVALAGGKSLTDVLRQVLSEEPRVVTVNLNYVER